MRILIFIVVLSCSYSVFSQSTNSVLRRRHYNVNNGGVALRQFDPVTYFQGKPRPGQPKFTHLHSGIRYYFLNEENVEIFKKDPGKYEPAYGGWCAYNMAASGKKVEIDPATFKIIGGKVYLFSHKNGVNEMIKWNKNEKHWKESADKYWSKVYR